MPSLLQLQRDRRAHVLHRIPELLAGSFQKPCMWFCLIGDDVLHWFDCLSKTLDCMPAAHGSGASVAQDRIGRIVLRVDDRRRQLCCQKAVICCDGQIVFLNCIWLDQLPVDGLFLMMLICVMECHERLSCAGCLMGWVPALFVLRP